MKIVMILSVIICIIVVLVTALVTSKAYSVKHSVDPVPADDDKNNVTNENRIN